MDRKTHAWDASAAQAPAGTADIFPVVVLYKCRCADAASWRTLVRPGRFPAFMVYDNSPSTYAADVSALPAGAVYVRDEANGGLSKAYNCAARYARQRGYRRLLLLDQDTVFDAGAAEVYASADRSVPLWAAQLHTASGQPFSPVSLRGLRPRGVSLPAGRYSLADYAAVNSGLCVDLSCFFAAGGYNEAVRLDFADFQFLRRLRRVAGGMEVLPVRALQDFSNDATDVEALLARYRLYLESARACERRGLCERFRHFADVGLHALALFRRTRRLKFISLWFKSFVLEI